MEKKEFTVEEFLKGLQGYEYKCDSCKFWDSKIGFCNKHAIRRVKGSEKCKDWCLEKEME